MRTGLSTKISEIQQESEMVKDSFRQGKINKKAVATLKKHIQTFEKDHRPSLDHRKLIGEAKLTVEAAETGEVLSTLLFWPHKNRSLAPEENFSVEDFFTIAGLIDAGKLGEAKSRLNQLLSLLKKAALKTI